MVKKETEGVTVKSPEQAKKEILDVELELMTKTTKGEDTLELKKKLLDLQKIVSLFAHRFHSLLGAFFNQFSLNLL